MDWFSTNLVKEGWSVAGLFSTGFIRVGWAETGLVLSNSLVL